MKAFDDPRVIREMHGNQEIIDAAFRLFAHLDEWPMKSPERFRNTMLGYGSVLLNPMLDFGTNERAKAAITTLVNALTTVVAEGRLIDFGFVPNRVMMETALATQEAFEANELQHPFEDWLGTMRWEGGFCGYYVFSKLGTLECTVMELYGVTIPLGDPLADIMGASDIVVVNDVLGISHVSPNNTMISNAPLIDLKGIEELYAKQMEPGQRAANILDPLATMLRFLSDASIPITHVAAPARLNQQRRKAGKMEIPSHNVVWTKDYVTRVQHHHAAGGNHGRGGGHHASPVAHWRRAHTRHLSTGKVVPVRSTKVNWRSMEELHRSFYRVEVKR